MSTGAGSNPPGIEELYPSDVHPELRMGNLSSLCSFAMTPRIMTGFLRQLLHQHYCDEQNIHNSYLRGWLRDHGTWNAGVTTGLLIEALVLWRPELTEARPAIVIKDNDWTWQRMGIGDQAGQTWRDGRRFYAGLWQGSHTVFAIGNEPAETQILAAETARLLLWYSQLIVCQLGLHRFVMVTIGSLRVLEESKDNYVVPITVAYVKEEAWYLQEDAPRLKRIVFNVEELLRGT